MSPRLPVRVPRAARHLAVAKKQPETPVVSAQEREVGGLGTSKRKPSTTDCGFIAIRYIAYLLLWR